KTIEFARKGARRAVQQFAYGEAVRLTEMALRVLESATVADRALKCELTIEYGEALHRAGSPDRSRKVLEPIFSQSRQIGRYDLMARAALAFGANSATVTTVDTRLIEILEEAIAALPLGDSRWRVMLSARLGAALCWSTFRERSTQLCEDAVRMARRIQDPLCQIHALSMWHYTTWNP